jgi:hypothetical protein
MSIHVPRSFESPQKENTMNNSHYKQTAIGVVAHSVIVFYMTSPEVLSKLDSIQSLKDTNLLAHPQYEVFRKEVTEILRTDQVNCMDKIHVYFEDFVG